MNKNFFDALNNTNWDEFVTNKNFEDAKKEKENILEFKELKDSYFGDKRHFSACFKKGQTIYKINTDLFIEEDGNLSRAFCNCLNFRASRSCEHIAALLINYYDIFYDKNYLQKKKEQFVLKTLNSFLSNAVNIKREVDVEIRIKYLENYEDDNYYYYNKKNKIEIKLYLGELKKYLLNSRFNAFWEAYSSGKGEVKFGKDFTYNPSIHYFSKENMQKLQAYYNFANGNFRMTDYRNIKNFLNGIKDVSLIFNEYSIQKIKEKFPISTYLKKINNGYELSFDIKNVSDLTDDYEFIYYHGSLYHLSAKEKELLSNLKDQGISNLEIPKDKIDLFTKGLLSTVRDELNIDPMIDDLIIPKNIKTQLYFDLRTNKIYVEPNFIYDGIVVKYFDSNSVVLRDMVFETEVINDLLKYSFIIEKNKIVLNSLEDQVDFIENDLEILAAKYEVFTTEKFKGITIKKKTNVSSMFGIGQDNIMSYNFNLGDINPNELVNIFKEIKNKKKYYRLKNGDILNIEDNALKELESLSSDLELTDEEIIMGHGSILKYRAIYLDSLKNNKYSIIETDNLFNSFINNFYKFKDSNLTISKKEMKVLRDYQVIGVKWLYNLAKTGFGGILADEMGLGKTIQVIYYIKQMLLDNKNNKFLIVVPTSLAYNWEHEFDEFAPEIDKVICSGNKLKRNAILSDKLPSVIITTYGLLREDEDIYEKLSFNTMIIDEAQNIKNNMAGITKVVKKQNAETKFALTGTPIENSILELWSIFDFIMPGYLSSLAKFQNKYNIKDYSDEVMVLINGLNKQIKPFILRRKKEDVTKELPEKLLNNMYLELTDEQKKLYVAELENVKKEMNDIMQNGGISKARFLILQLLMKLRQICIDPAMIYENYSGSSNKMEMLLNIIREYILNEHKILVFSSFRKALDIVQKNLEKEEIASYLIDGSVPSKKRIEYVDDFNNSSNVKVFLIMLKAGGTGLNLTGADVVVHLDLWWNPQAENQATDRAHRIGQTKTVEVIHLITKGTIEEKILELQDKKKVLSDKIIDGESRNQNIIANLEEDDIKNLLAYENSD